MRMLLYQHLRRYLFISILCLLLNHSIYTLAQHQVTLNDLPKCAIPCADEAASAVGCQTTDILCLCAHQISIATIRCSISECHPNSLAMIDKVLNEMCTAVSTATTSTPSLPTIQSSQISTTTSPITLESTSTSQTSSTSTTSSITTSTVSSTTPNVVSSLSQTTTQLASSTVFIVTTVVMTPTATSNSGAGRLDVSIGARALFFCLSSLISLVAAI